MATVLKNEVNPLDATIESVLPGVLQIQRTTQTSVDQLSSKVDSFKESRDAIAEGITEQLQGLVPCMKRCLDDNQSEGHRKLARCFMSIGQQLMDLEDTNNDQNGVRRVLRRPLFDNDLFESPIPSFDTEEADEEQDVRANAVTATTTERAVSVMTNRDAVASCLNTASPPKKRKLAPKYHTIQQILDDWQHREDGILKLNEKYGNTWRKHFTSSEKTAYSRLSRVYDGIAKFIEAKEGEDVPVVIAELEEIYKQKRLSVKGMLAYLQEEGYVGKKKSRGRTKKDDDVDE